MEIMNSSRRSAQPVRQDVYDKIFTINITTIQVWVAKEISDRPYQKLW